MNVQQEWLALQKIDSGWQFSENRASKVPSSGTTPRPLSKTCRPFGRLKFVRQFEVATVLDTNVYRCIYFGVAAPVVQKTPIIWEAPAAIEIVPSVGTFRVCGDRYPRAAHADVTRIFVHDRDHKPFPEADTDDPCSKDDCTQLCHSGIRKSSYALWRPRHHPHIQWQAVHSKALRSFVRFSWSRVGYNDWISSSDKQTSRAVQPNTGRKILTLY